MHAICQHPFPKPGTDPKHVAVQLVMCDQHGLPRRQKLWGVLSLLRRVSVKA